jgi:S1-C subfamily serine protease
MSILTSLSSDLASIVESTGRGTVKVDARRGGAASGVVWTTNDLVITANHVLTRDENIHVSIGDDKAFEAELVGRDPTTDLALLRLDKSVDFSPEWVEIKGLKVGHFVLALGRPGKTVRATLGIVSVLGESWHTSAGGAVDNYIQTDASFYPGFSGGPLVTVEGKVIGVTTSGLLRGETVTVPYATVKSVVDELLKHGRISHGYLGVGIQPARLPEEIARQTGQHVGLLIISVEPGSPGEKTGLVLGDTILTIGETKLMHWNDLIAALSKDRIGTNVVLQVLRAGHVQELKATIGERP